VIALDKGNLLFNVIGIVVPASLMLLNCCFENVEFVLVAAPLGLPLEPRPRSHSTARRRGRLRIRAWSCRYLVFLVGAAHHDPERVIRQWPLQRLGLIPRCAHPHVPLLVDGQDRSRQEGSISVFPPLPPNRDIGQFCRWHSCTSEPRLRNPALTASHRA